MKATLALAAALLLLGALASAADPDTGLPELKPVPGKPVSVWFNYRTGDFSGASQIWGELRNDSKTALGGVRIVFVSLDANGREIAASEDSVGKLAPGETWSFEIHPRETGVKRFELKDVAFADESCSLEAREKDGESCVACDAWDGDTAKCVKRLAPKGYARRCRGAGTEKWTEVWCRAAK